MGTRLVVAMLFAFVVEVGCAGGDGTTRASSVRSSSEVSCEHPDYPSRACWLSGSADTIDLQLYTAGLNHAEIDPHNNFVHQEGIRALADFIERDAPDPDRIVVALSASGVDPCDAGNEHNPLAPVYNGQCLAHELETRFGRKYTLAEAYPADTHWGGPALIAGPEWEIVANEHLTIDGEDVLRADLVDSQGRAFAIFVVHTKANESMSSEMETIAKFALDRPMLSGREAYVTPLFVGDFNTPTCSRSGECTHASRVAANDTGADDAVTFLEDNFDFLDEALTCPPQDGLPTSTPFRLENDILHVLSGKRSGPLDFACASGAFEIVRISYSTADGVHAACPANGVKIKGVSHNVLAFGLKIGDARPVRCASTEQCRRAACVPRPDHHGHDDETCDGQPCCEAKCNEVQAQCEAGCASRGHDACRRCDTTQAGCLAACAQ